MLMIMLYLHIRDISFSVQANLVIPAYSNVPRQIWIGIHFNDWMDESKWSNFTKSLRNMIATLTHVYFFPTELLLYILYTKLNIGHDPWVPCTRVRASRAISTLVYLPAATPHIVVGLPEL